MVDNVTYPTLPSSGPISFSTVEQLVSGSSGYSAGLSFVRAHTKDSITDIGGIRGRAYFTSTMGGNCSNGNCVNPNCGGGNKGPTNCSNTALTSANGGNVNCDGQGYFQANCNCNCVYNCTQTNDQYYNCNCNCNCNCWFSDDRLKDKEGPITNALDKVSNLKGFYYRGNERGRELGVGLQRELGLSAQDIERIIPEGLGESSQGFLTVNYAKLVPLLVEAIKELNQKINNLEKGQ
jgi:hypothetical protein